MKVRLGFVSNSSSSSFTIMMTEENHEKVLKEVHPFIKAVVEAMGITKGKFGGKNIVSLGYLSGMDGSWDEYLEVNYEGKIPKSKEYGGDMERFEAFELYCKEANKSKADVFEVSHDG